MVWQPNHEEILVVACQKVILIWTIDPSTTTFRATTDCVRVINIQNFFPITSIAFEPTGDRFVVCSPQSSKLLLVTMSGEYPVQNVSQFSSRITGTGLTKLSWSPNKTRLFSSTTSSFIRIYENEAWSYGKWSKEFDELSQVAVWSKPTGRYLLVAQRNYTIIYAIAFFDPIQANDVGGTVNCMKALDVSERVLENGTKVGGRVHDMVWDQNSERLAISFKGKVNLRSIVAIMYYFLQITQ